MINKKIKLSAFSSELSLRCDVDFSIYQSNNNFSNSYSFNDLFELVPHTSIENNLIANDFNYCEIGDVDNNGFPKPNLLNLNNTIPEYEDLYKKISKGDIFKPKKGNIILSKVRPYLNKTILINSNCENVLFTKAFIEIHPIKENLILYYSLRSLFLENIVIISRQGKGYPTINDKDLKYLRFKKSVIDPLFSKSKSINNLIENETNKIAENFSKIKSWTDIINDYFSSKFNFSEKEYYNFGKGMSCGTQNSNNRKMRLTRIKFSDLSSSNILRCSERFHNNESKKLTKLLNNYKTIELGSWITACIKGVQPEYVENGDINVIKIANLKNGYVDISECEKIDFNQYKEIDDEKKLKKNDLILCSTGKCSLGRADIYEHTESGITAADNFVIRFNEDKCNPYFVSMFLNCILGIFQIERDYTGCTNQIHLYEREIRKIKIFDLPIDKQNKIVKEFKEIYDNQQNYNLKITNSISTIIESLKK